MKELITTVMIILSAALIIAIMPTESEAEIYEDTLRLHILANSDSESDQSVKLEIRNRVLEKYSTELSNYGDISTAKEKLTELIPSIKADVDIWLSELGNAYTSDVTLSEEWYDTREYEDFTLPRGYYSSLRIIIGNGEGKNWWCVMFPPMCLDIATEKAPPDDGIVDYTKEETKLITAGGFNIKFKLLEIASSTISKVSKKG